MCRYITIIRTKYSFKAEIYLNDLYKYSNKAQLSEIKVIE